MALRNGRQYVESLRDDRLVYFLGERVPDVTTHDFLRRCVETGVFEYEVQHRPDLQELCVVIDPKSGEMMARYFQTPRSSHDLLKRWELIDTLTHLACTYPPSLRTIGTDSLNALAVTAGQMGKFDYRERVEAFRGHLIRNDLAMALAMTDVKGDRTLSPLQQSHPDYYVRVVEETREGIIVRGGKAHNSLAPYVNEILVIPSRAVRGEEEKDYAIAFAVPPHTKGVKIICGLPMEHLAQIYLEEHSLAFPTGQPLRPAVHCLTVFDDVLVPWERVFFYQEWQHAGLLARNFATFHRLFASTYKYVGAKLLTGAAQAIAEYNGVARASHIRDKLTHMIIYTDTLKALIRAALVDCIFVDDIAVPHPEVSNMAKFHFANHYHQFVKCLQDIAGSLVCTAPSHRDFVHPEIGPDVEKYLGGAAGVSTEARLRMFQLIREETASYYGGLTEIVSLHGEGSLEAQKMTIYAESHIEEYKEFAERVAGITG